MKLMKSLFLATFAFCALASVAGAASRGSYTADKQVNRAQTPDFSMRRVLVSTSNVAPTIVMSTNTKRLAFSLVNGSTNPFRVAVATAASQLVGGPYAEGVYLLEFTTGTFTGGGQHIIPVGGISDSGLNPCYTGPFFGYTPDSGAIAGTPAAVSTTESFVQ